MRCCVDGITDSLTGLKGCSGEESSGPRVACPAGKRERRAGGHVRARQRDGGAGERLRGRPGPAGGQGRSGGPRGQKGEQGCGAAAARWRPHGVRLRGSGAARVRASRAQAGRRPAGSTKQPGAARSSCFCSAPRRAPAPGQADFESTTFTYSISNGLLANLSINGRSGSMSRRLGPIGAHSRLSRPIHSMRQPFRERWAPQGSGRHGPQGDGTAAGGTLPNQYLSLVAR
jgi:hypothetical protein